MHRLEEVELELQEQCSLILRDIAISVVYEQIRDYIVPTAIRHVSDVLIRKVQKPRRDNPLVGVIESVMNDSVKTLASEVVVNVRLSVS